MYRYTRKVDRSPSPAATPDHPAGEQVGDAFTRDAPTWLSYAALGCFTFWLYAFGPALTLLREELRFSYSVLGAYELCWSAGAAAAGAGFARASRRLARGTLLWTSALGVTAGAGVFVLGRSVPATLAGAAVFGAAGTMLLAVVQAVLSARHGSRRDRALTEANIGAGAASVFAPLALGALAGSVLGWRATFAVPAVALLVLYLRYRHLPLPPPVQHGNASRSGPLPLACWLFTVLTALSSAIEFCLVYFGPQVLIGIGLSAGAAGTALSANFLGILLGRVLGARLTRRPGRSTALLCASLGLTLVSVVLFWLSRQPTLAVVALFSSGVGIANLYPLALSLTLEAADGREDEANARSQLVLGVLAGIFPYLLGTLADRHGLTTGFALEPALIILCFFLLWGGVRTRRHHR
ncbi:MFS transporter [Kineococcus glutinatus]|uniref:MFS transporter n=1 Tax=Kineococcus glutinatus TaxID=1070872 RepID=UPI0031ECA169